MAKRGRGETLSVDVCEKLRLDIFDRRLSPGERLKAAELGQRFGVSISVMREALGQLAGEDLVVIERNRGFHVTTLSSEALSSLTEARKIAEGAALRLSVQRGDVAWESEVLAAHHLLASEPIYDPNDGTARNKRWVEAHLAFHYKLIEGCANQVLLDMCARLSNMAELYRAWSSHTKESVKRDVAAEHRALMEAALAHHTDLAVARFEAHLERTAELALQASG